MRTTNNTVLITGGSAGIGLAMARLFSQNGNDVVINGRNAQRLAEAASTMQNVTAIPCDVTHEEEVDELVHRIKQDFPRLNILINNAGGASVYKLSATANAFEKAADEIMINYLSIVSLTEKLLPLLSTQPEAAIVNVSSIVAFVPGTNLPTYSASKAALHSYTQTLRYTLRDTAVKVFELMPPLVNTELSREIGGQNGIPPQAVADDLLTALENDHYEIHTGGTAQLYKLFLSSPAQAMEVMNQGR